MKVVGNTGWQERLVSRRQTQSRPMDVMRDGLLATHSAVRVLRSKPANIDTRVIERVLSRQWTPRLSHRCTRDGALMQRLRTYMKIRSCRERTVAERKESCEGGVVVAEDRAGASGRHGRLGRGHMQRDGLFGYVNNAATYSVLAGWPLARSISPPTHTIDDPPWPS